MLPVLALLLPLVGFVAGFAPLQRNIAYRSPTLTTSSLAHDIDHIGAKIVKRSTLGRRSLESARGGHAADQLVIDYDSAKGIDGQDSYHGSFTFPYGVASGDPLDDSAILWTHPVPKDADTVEPICLRYQTSKVKDSWHEKDLVDSSYAWTTSDVDYSFKVETQLPEPKTRYYYRFFGCHDHSLVSPTGTFTTMPSPDDETVGSLKMAVFSCSNYPFGYFNSFGQAAKSDVDLVAHVGDYIYESAGDGSPDAYGDGRPLNRVPQPNREIVTLDDYRLRYATYRSDPDLQRLHQKKPWLLIWDDHEVADNSWKAGTADSNDTAAGTVEGVRFTERKKNAVKAYFEWMPIRQVDTAGDTLRIWRKFQYGKLADIAMLDTRNYDRDITDLYYNTAEVASLANDTARSLMGGKQERWLYHNLIHSQKRGATWKLIGQQIIVNHLNYGEADFPVDYDAWDGYEANRRRLFDTIRANDIQNVILLSGDSHAAWVYDAIYQEWENRTDLYDPSTGRGALAVEFAGTAVSSPSSYGAKLTPAQYVAQAEKLVSINRNLAFAEGGHRGYFTLDVRPNELDASFWGIVNNTQQSSDQILLAKFNVQKGANRLTRPINNGKPAKGGALQAQIIDYSKQQWNGSGFS
ncbi:hypothetical protein FA10DRAFT_297687 [Acaromyces ingoldii]|uniref:Alkaline phosphatase n=1 Tax=Acaromyces ingoldii TaxID=215250 RepID=A0A316YEG8_9BASI|nr:hypothetical protein FA10DRAFT_297687 [Acaromyces ingoldii]PWN87274.1 hypothetical protein FA10DRAFT_297687 [Acaromyces ingoldii]